MEAAVAGISGVWGTDMVRVVPQRTAREQGRSVLRALRLAAVAGGAALLAACQVVPKGAEPAAPPPPPTQAQTGPTAGLPTDTDRHRVALLVPRTGSNADVGESIANATQLALLDTGSDRLRITTYDTATGAAAAAKQAIADGNRLILGPLLAQDVEAVSTIARAAGVPVLSFSNDASVAGNGVFILGFVPGQSVERAVSYAKAQGQSRFAALIPKTTYGARAEAAFRQAVADNGGSLVAVESYDRTVAAMSGAARRIANAPAHDALLIADAGSNAIRIVPLSRPVAGAAPRILGTELWNTDTGVANSTALRGAWFASVSDGLYRQLVTKYRARFGKAPFRLASLGYDSVLLTVRVARNWKPATAFPTDRLMASDGFGGIDGIFRFDRRGIAQRALEVSEVGPGGFKVIDAAPTKW